MACKKHTKSTDVSMKPLVFGDLETNSDIPELFKCALSTPMCGIGRRKEVPVFKMNNINVESLVFAIADRNFGITDINSNTWDTFYANP